MSSLIPITRQPDSLQGYQLTAPGDMIAALDYLAGAGYSGNISLSLNGATKNYQLWINSKDQSNSQSALIGDWIVIKNNATASVVPAAQFPSLYTHA